MKKILIVKLDSRNPVANEQEDKIVQALSSIGLKYDGSDVSLGRGFNRCLYFFSNDNIDFEITDLDETESD